MSPRHVAKEHSQEVLEKSKAEGSDFMTTVSRLFSQADLQSKNDEKDGGKYKWLNTVLGVIAFCLIGYLLKVMRPKGPSGSSGKSMFGGKKSSSKGSGMFGGRSSTGSSKSSMFGGSGGKRGRR